MKDVSSVQDVRKKLELKQRRHGRDPIDPVMKGRRHGDQDLRPEREIQNHGCGYRHSVSMWNYGSSINDVKALGLRGYQGFYDNCTEAVVRGGVLNY